MNRPVNDDLDSPTPKQSPSDSSRMVTVLSRVVSEPIVLTGLVAIGSVDTLKLRQL